MKPARTRTTELRALLSADERVGSKTVDLQKLPKYWRENPLSDPGSFVLHFEAQLDLQLIELHHRNPRVSSYTELLTHPQPLEARVSLSDPGRSWTIPADHCRSLPEQAKR